MCRAAICLILLRATRVEGIHNCAVAFARERERSPPCSAFYFRFVRRPSSWPSAPRPHSVLHSLSLTHSCTSIGKQHNSATRSLQKFHFSIFFLFYFFDFYFNFLSFFEYFIEGVVFGYTQAFFSPVYNAGRWAIGNSAIFKRWTFHTTTFQAHFHSVKETTGRLFFPFILKFLLWGLLYSPEID